VGILEVKNVSLQMKDKYILRDVSIDFWQGHIHAIVGPNGAGKSTLAHTVMGLSDYRHHTGDIFLEGKSIKASDITERANLGITLAWQEPARFEGITVEAFIRAAADGQNSGGTNDSIVEETLNMVGLDPADYMSRAIDKTLSGGERKRIEVASIIAMNPTVVLMDEPDSGIDTDAIESIFKVIHRLKEGGATVILITHSVRVLQQADHAFLLCHGQLVDKGTADTMKAYFEGKCIPCPHKNEPIESEVSA
jgi:Fe-S cluster assembly ATP-binding protein